MIEIAYTRHFNEKCQARKFLKKSIENCIIESSDVLPDSGKVYIVKRLELNGKEDKPLPFLIIVGEVKNYKTKLFRGVTVFRINRLDVIPKIVKSNYKIIFI